MEVKYGVPGHYIDVTLPTSITGDYNSLFDDPMPGARKELRIVHPTLSAPVIVMEGCPLHYDDSGQTPHVFVVSTHAHDGVLTVPDPYTWIYEAAPHCPGSFLMYCNPTDQPHIQQLMNDITRLLSLFPNIQRITYRKSEVVRCDSLFSGLSYVCCDMSSYSFIVSVYPPHRYLRIDPKPGFGLINQLLNVANCCSLAHKTGSHVVYPMFSPHYVSSDTIPLSQIIDTEHINRYMGYGAIVHTVMGGWVASPDRSDLWKLLPSMDDVSWVIDHMFLDIGCSLPVLPRSEEALDIMKNLRFTAPIMEVVHYCVSMIGRDYNTLHLRLEDDWINIAYNASHIFEAVSRSLYQEYLNAMTDIFDTSDRVYIATYLTKASNKNNYLVDELRTHYPNLLMNVEWRSVFSLPEGREIDALIDYLVAIRGNKLVGCKGSTFSELLARVMNVPTRLIGSYPCY